VPVRRAAALVHRDAAFGRFPGGRLLAEEYLPGTLRTLETLGDGQRMWVFGGFRTTLSPLPDQATLMPGELDSGYQELAQLEPA
jgi:hypothetical protein